MSGTAVCAVLTPSVYDALGVEDSSSGDHDICRIAVRRSDGLLRRLRLYPVPGRTTWRATLQSDRREDESLTMSPDIASPDDMLAAVRELAELPTLAEIADDMRRRHPWRVPAGEVLAAPGRRRPRYSTIAARNLRADLRHMLPTARCSVSTSDDDVISVRWTGDATRDDVWRIARLYDDTQRDCAVGLQRLLIDVTMTAYGSACRVALPFAW